MKQSASPLNVSSEQIDAALEEALRHHYEKKCPPPKKKGEFTVSEYAKINGIKRRAAEYIIHAAVENGEMIVCREQIPKLYRLAN